MNNQYLKEYLIADLHLQVSAYKFYVYTYSFDLFSDSKLVAKIESFLQNIDDTKLLFNFFELFNQEKFTNHPKLEFDNFTNEDFRNKFFKEKLFDFNLEFYIVQGFAHSAQNKLIMYFDKGSEIVLIGALKNALAIFDLEYNNDNILHSLISIYNAFSDKEKAKEIILQLTSSYLPEIKVDFNPPAEHKKVPFMI